MQFKTLIVLGTFIAGIGAAAPALAFPQVDGTQSSFTAASVHTHAGFDTHRDGPYQEANRQLRIAGLPGLDNEPDPTTGSASLFAIADAQDNPGSWRRAPFGWLPEARFNERWNSLFGYIEVRDDYSNFRRRDRLAPRAEPRAAKPAPAEELAVASVVGNEASSVLSLLRSVFAAVQSGVSNTMAMLRGTRTPDPLSV